MEAYVTKATRRGKDEAAPAADQPDPVASVGGVDPRDISRGPLLRGPLDCKLVCPHLALLSKMFI